MRNTFEYYDEDAYLEHHGIKGQKWGIRRYQNPDGSLTEEGKKRYGRINSRTAQPKLHKVFAKASYKDDVSEEVFNTLHADKKYLNQARDILQKNTDTQKEITKEVDEMFSELRSPENIHIYEAASELAAYAQYARAYPNNDFYKSDVDDFTFEQLGQAGFMGVLEDGQQSDINAYSMYASRHDLEKKVDELERVSTDSSKNAREEATKVISDGLSEVSADNLSVYPKNPDYKVSTALVTHMMNSDHFDNWEDTSGAWYAYEASKASTITKQDKQNIDKAEAYVRKIDNASDQNTWWYVHVAADNLGLDSVKLSNMTQSDWDRVNAEIRKLRSKDLER